MSDEELSPDEVVFLATALDGPTLAFAPLEDPMIAELIHRKLVALHINSDPKHALLDLTPAGRQAVKRTLR